MQFSDEAAETVARDELLAVQLEPRRGRGVVGLEPLLDGAALVRMAIYLLALATGRGDECTGQTAEFCGRGPQAI